MRSSFVREFADPDAYHAAIDDAQTRGIVTQRGNFRSEWIGVRLDRLSLQRSTESLARTSFSAIDPQVAAFLFSTRPGPPVYVHGIETAHGEIIAYCLGASGHDRSTAASRWAAVALAPDDLAAAGHTIIGRELGAPAVTQLIRPPAAALARLAELHAAAGRLAKTQPGLLVHPETARALEQQMAHALVSCLAGGEAVERGSTYHRHAAIMRRFEELLEANPDRSLYLAELCAATGASERTLRACCEERLGMSPMQYLRLRRMHLARRAPRSADPSATTVTEVATSYGFWELGRFAVAYRGLFGEPPSASLSRPPDYFGSTYRRGSPWSPLRPA